jgi:hypothetical protein
MVTVDRASPVTLSEFGAAAPETEALQSHDGAFITPAPPP